MKKELQSTLKWDIRSEPVTINNTYNTHQKAIIRNDNNRLLGIVGRDYCPVSNAQMLQFIDKLTSNGEFELKGFDELNQGRKLLAFLENKGTNLKLNNCNMKEYLVIGNSHDGTKPFYIGTNSTLTRCENQFYSTLKVFRQKHTSVIDFSDISIQNMVSSYKAMKSGLYKSFEGMENIRVDQKVVDHLVKDIHKMLDIDSSLVKTDWGKSPSMMILRQSIENEMKDLGHNAFGLFNGVTWYTSHEMRNSESNISRVEGTANKINQKALRFCLNMKKKAKDPFPALNF